MDLAKKARSAMEEKKGGTPRIFDVRRISEVADYMVVVSGTSPPHLRAMFDGIQQALKNEGIHCHRRAGTPECGWMLLDYVDVVIHIFSPAARHYYAVEELWARARTVE